MTVLIRPALPCDCPLLVDFIRELAIYEKLDHEVRIEPEILNESLFGPAPTAYALVAFADGSPAGFCLYFFNFSTFLGRPGIYIEDIFVREAFRGRGIGKRFFQSVFATARDRQCGRVEWSVLDWNRPAIDFYESMQAKPMAEWTVYRLDREQYIAHLAQ